MEDPDWDVIQACLNGRQDVYKDIVVKYQPEISARMWRFSRNRTVCEELTQDVFVEAYLSLKNYRADAPFKHWLYRIATHVGYKYWKTVDKNKKFITLEETDRAVYDNIENIDSHRAAEALHNVLAGLKPKDRLVLTLLYFDNCSMEQISNQTGWSVPAVKMRAHRAKKRLLKTIKNKGIMDDLL